MSEHPERHDGFVNPSVKFEPTDLSLRAVLTFSGALAAVIVLVSIGLWFMIPAFLGPTPPQEPFSSNKEGPWADWNKKGAEPPPVPDSSLPRPPELEGIDRIAPADEGGDTHTRRIKEQIDEEEQTLNAPAGVDEKTGKAHIPIEDAMKRLAGEAGEKP